MRLTNKIKLNLEIVNCQRDYWKLHEVFVPEKEAVSGVLRDKIPNKSVVQ